MKLLLHGIRNKNLSKRLVEWIEECLIDNIFKMVNGKTSSSYNHALILFVAVTKR